MFEGVSAGILAVFIPTFLFVSITPGMCMTLSLSLGMSVGLKRSLHMMWGELLGVGLVATCAAVGVAAIMLRYPAVFVALKILGGLYLGWLGFQMWRSRGSLAIPESLDVAISTSRLDLALRGFLTAIANPKGWAFFVALLPPFLDQSKPLAPQLMVLIAVILSLEFLSLLMYSAGGQALRQVLLQKGKVRMLNRISGSLLLGVGVWLMLG